MESTSPEWGSATLPGNRPAHSWVRNELHATIQGMKLVAIMNAAMMLLFYYTLCKVHSGELDRYDHRVLFPAASCIILDIIITLYAIFL